MRYLFFYFVKPSTLSSEIEMLSLHETELLPFEASGSRALEKSKKRYRSRYETTLQAPKVHNGF